jgi:hypothetical protein
MDSIISKERDSTLSVLKLLSLPGRHYENYLTAELEKLKCRIYQIKETLAPRAACLANLISPHYNI